jgi:hypothetical protein
MPAHGWASRSDRPQDAYKSPVNLALAVRGALRATPAVGYNATFAYPVDGLDALCRRIAGETQVRYGMRAVAIDPAERVVRFANGVVERYTTLLSTLPLPVTLAMAGLRVDAATDPHTSVLVLNVGARRGAAGPDDQWIHLPASRAGFHRVGFYDNVDPDFVPPARDGPAPHEHLRRAGLGRRRAARRCGGRRRHGGRRELQDWASSRDVEVADPTWIDVAYTWSWPGSTWCHKPPPARRPRHPRDRPLCACVFQGIAESLHEGFAAGTAVRR